MFIGYKVCTALSNLCQIKAEIILTCDRDNEELYELIHAPNYKIYLPLDLNINI